ncbi:DDE_4 domain-containing protein [Arachis hypogaea]|nr:DDE_4 domain-containing protein [Arachis hypogaea]
MHNGDDLNFSIGFSSSSFSLDNFFMSPRCGCRLNCDDEDNDEFRVRKFKGLDGTHIKVNVFDADKSRYRNSKGDITTNVLGVVTLDMQFIYVLASWEGSAADSRVMQDALFRNGFSVIRGILLKL